MLPLISNDFWNSIAFLAYKINIFHLYFKYHLYFISFKVLIPNKALVLVLVAFPCNTPVIFVNFPAANPLNETVSTSVLGRDFSGVVESVGHLVTRFKPGDEVSKCHCHRGNTDTYCLHHSFTIMITRMCLRLHSVQLVNSNSKF